MSRFTGPDAGPRIGGGYLRIGLLGTAAVATSLVLGGCGSGTVSSAQPVSFCGTLVPALRADARLVNQVEAHAQGYTANQPSRGQAEQVLGQLQQAFAKVTPLVPPARQSSFQSEQSFFGKAHGVMATTPDSQILSRLTELEKPYATAASSNNAYILQRCGGEQAVFGSQRHPRRADGSGHG